MSNPVGFTRDGTSAAATVSGGRPTSVGMSDRSRATSSLLVHLLLLGGAFYTMTLVGSSSEASRLGLDPGAFDSNLALDPDFLALGLPYSCCLLAILGVHEMGHYVACRIYGVRASLPFFLPGIPVAIGTFGAFIRIRSPIPDRRVLFDIGVAGPIAGFLVTLPVLAYGLVTAQPVPRTPDLGTVGEPLLLACLSWLAAEIPDGQVIMLSGPLMAGWVGCLATAINLFPVGQLDGGHASYAVSAGFHRGASIAAIATFAALGVFLYPSWLLLATLLLMFGPKHPPVLDEGVRLSWGRLLLAVACLLILVLCFIPRPLPVPDL